MLRRLALALLLVVWCGVCWVQWRANSVLIPTWTLDRQGLEVETPPGADFAVLRAREPATELAGFVDIVSLSETPRVGRVSDQDRQILEEQAALAGLKSARFQMKSQERGTLRRWYDWTADRLQLRGRQGSVLDLVMYDTLTNTNVGRLTSAATEFPEGYPVNSIGADHGLLTVTRKQLLYYSVPPRRDWMNLFAWCFAPPLLLGLAWEVVRTLRRQLTTPPVEPVTEIEAT